MAEDVFDVVAEDPEEEHVPAHVQPAPCMNIDVKMVSGPVLSGDLARPLELARVVTELEHGRFEAGR